ncbi:hypothetical protein P7K49_002659, partial [Saguinus oedipus]
FGQKWGSVVKRKPLVLAYDFGHGTLASISPAGQEGPSSVSGSPTQPWPFLQMRREDQASGVWQESQTSTREAAHPQAG